jgi:outer membrane protein TolC
VRSGKFGTWRHKGIALWFLIAAISPARAAFSETAGAALTLQDAVAQALAARPLLVSDYRRTEAARARVTQSRAAVLPRLEVQGSATDGPLGSPPLFLGGLAGTPIKKHTGASLNLTQTLLDFGRSRSQVLARKADVQAGEYAIAADENRVVLEVRRAYLAVLQGRELRTLNRELVEQRKLVVRQAEAYRAGGLGTRLDVDLAELMLSQAQLALVRSEGDLATAVADLGAAMGRELSADLELSGERETPGPLGGSPEQWASLALKDRPEMLQASAVVTAALHLIGAARAGSRPLLVGVGSVGKINPSPVGAASDKSFAVGLGVTIPLFTGKLVESQVEEARRNLAAFQATRDELGLQIRRQVQTAAATLAASEEAVRVAGLQQTRADDALKLGTERYRAQLGSIVELSQAQTAHAVARYDLVRAGYDRELARAALDFAVGRRWPSGKGGAR